MDLCMEFGSPYLVTIGEIAIDPNPWKKMNMTGINLREASGAWQILSI